MQTPNGEASMPAARWPIRVLAIAACMATITLEYTGQTATAGPHSTLVKTGARHTRAASPSSSGTPNKQVKQGKPPATRKAGAITRVDKCGRKREPLVLSGRLNLNTTSEKQLSLLPGIGPAKARRVIRWRARHRRFRRIRDLRRVRGFGYKTVKRLARYLSVKGESSLAWRSLDAAKALRSALKSPQKRPTRPTR